jgi:signal transduction histidine kinase
VTRHGGLRRRSRREWLAGALVLVGLFGFVVLAYAVIVIGGGALIGHASSPQVGLSVLATAFVALAFDPVQTRLERFASRTVHGGQPSPYDVLRRFSGTLTGSYAAEELPARMARVLADGTGAVWSQVWVVVGSRPVLAATWPPEAGDPGSEDADPLDESEPGRCSLPVRYGADLLGVLVIQERPGVPLTSVERRLFDGLASQAGLVLRGTRLRAELELRLDELSTRADELRVSRQRLVDAQDNGRRLLERDIHDGAQQHLVALAVNLRLADTLATRSPERAVELLAAQETAADDAIATHVQLSRGIYPPLLEDAGVAAALRGAVGGTAQAVEIVERDLGRYALGVEAAAYFTCLEAVQNSAKHSGASTIRVELCGEPAALTLTISDDGAGFDPDTTPPGTGLANMRDRVESVGGTLTTRSAPGQGTRIHAVLPATPPSATGAS